MKKHNHTPIKRGFHPAQVEASSSNIILHMLLYVYFAASVRMS